MHDENTSHLVPKESAVTLEQLAQGHTARIAEVVADEALYQRMLALGLRAGREVAVIRRARLGGTLQIRVGSTDLVIRPKEARRIRLTHEGPVAATLGS